VYVGSAGFAAAIYLGYKAGKACYNIITSALFGDYVFNSLPVYRIIPPRNFHAGRGHRLADNSPLFPGFDDTVIVSWQTGSASSFTGIVSRGGHYIRWTGPFTK
jgi:hypothetical protein